MRNTGVGKQWWWIGGAVVSLAGAVLLARQTIDEQRALFETDARIVHRLLSQQVVQHDAILDTLALLQPGPEAPGATPPEQRLPALYPHILSVQRRDRGGDWPDPALAGAETASRQHQRPALATVELGSGRYRLVLAAEPTAYALGIDLRAMVPWAEWPMKPETSPVRVRLDHAGQSFTLQPGDPTALNTGRGWRFEFHKHLAAQSQPFDVVASRQMGWLELPWGRMLAWLAAVALVLTALAQWQGQRAARRRAEELLRLGQVARLNTLGELAAGMAHELNQPLTAVLANTQAAQRLLADEPPELDTARSAAGCSGSTPSGSSSPRATEWPSPATPRSRRAAELPMAVSGWMSRTCPARRSCSCGRPKKCVAASMRSIRCLSGRPTSWANSAPAQLRTFWVQSRPS